jgi:kojibiose phosphorylase
VTGFDPATKLFEQFAGYVQLEEIDVVAQRSCATPIDTCLGPERIRRSKAVKQADVVALSALLWDKWPVAVHQANFRYYEARTAHGSSLSPALHALVAARLADRTLAQAYFRQAAEIDLANNIPPSARVCLKAIARHRRPIDPGKDHSARLCRGHRKQFIRIGVSHAQQVHC